VTSSDRNPASSLFRLSMPLPRAAAAVASAIPVALGDPRFLCHGAVPTGTVLESRTVDPLRLDARQAFRAALCRGLSASRPARPLTAINEPMAALVTLPLSTRKGNLHVRLRAHTLADRRCVAATRGFERAIALDPHIAARRRLGQAATA